MRNHFKLIFALSLVSLALARSAFAASPMQVTSGGDIVSWNASSTISYHTEGGACSEFDNTEMLTFVEDDLALWDDLVDVELTFDMNVGVIPDVDGTNYTNYLFTGSGTDTDTALLEDEVFPLVFDDDGEITAALTGEENVVNVLGFAGPTAYNDSTGEIVDGQGVFNCRCVANHPRYNECSDSSGNTVTVTQEDLEGTIVHEFGHFLGMDHSQANLDAFVTETTDDNDDIPIMFPIAFSAPSGVHVTADDTMSLALVYPSNTFVNSFCLIKGTLMDKDGQPLRCADVQAVTNDPADTVSFVSGAMATATDENDDGDTVDDDECTDGCGDFELYLDPDKEYTLTVKAIDDAFTGGSSLAPCVNEQLTTIEEEELTTITSAECVANQTHLLGEIDTQSTAGSSSSGGSSSSDSGSSGSSGSSSSSSGASGGGSESGSSSDPNGYWCALSPDLAATGSGFASLAMGVIFSLLLAVRMRVLSRGHG